MDVSDLEQWLKARPFEPFLMRLTTGEVIRIDHPDAAVPGINAVLVLYKRRGRLVGFSHFSLYHVVQIEPAGPSANGRARQRKRRRA